MFQGPARITEESDKSLVARFKLVGSDMEIPYTPQALAELKESLEQSVESRDGSEDPGDPAKLASDKLSLRNIEIALEQMAHPSLPQV